MGILPWQRSINGIDMPAWLGVQGPGEITIRAGLIRSISST